MIDKYINSQKMQGESQINASIISSRNRILQILPKIYEKYPTGVSYVEITTDPELISRRTVSVILQLIGKLGSFAPALSGYSGIFSHNNMQDKKGMFRLRETEGGMNLYSIPYFDYPGERKEIYIDHIENLTFQDFDDVKDHLSLFR